MRSNLFLFVALWLLLPFYGVAYDWSSIPVPAYAGSGKVWQLQTNLSDDFNYTFNAVNYKTNFGNNKWTNFYHSQWDGPGTTYWKYNHVSVNNKYLVLRASRWNKSSQPNPQYPYPGATEAYKMNLPNKGVNTGCVTSTKRVKYPVYVEAAVSVANIPLASCVWLLSPSDKQEIDILENYGGVDYFKQFTHLSHHSFIRSPFHDYQPRDHNSWYPDSRVSASYGWGDYCWNNGNRRFIRVGVYWVGPHHFEYYLDGQLVRVLYKNAMATKIKGQWQYTYYNAIYPAGTKDAYGNNIGGTPTQTNGYSDVTLYKTTSTYSFSTLQETSNKSKGISVIDPGNYQGGTGFTEELDIIINFESQSWLVGSNKTPTDAQLNDPARNKMLVDWIRVYKPVAAQQTVADGVYEIRSVANNKNLAATSWTNWNTVTVQPGNYYDQRWRIRHLGNNVYEVKLAASWVTKYLSVPNSGCTNGTNVGTSGAATANNQKWKIVRNGSYYAFKPVHCQSRAMDRKPGSGPNGSASDVHLWYFSSSNNNQKWKLIPSTLKSANLAETPEEDACSLQIFPTPTTSVLHIQGIEGEFTARIYDLNGRCVGMKEQVLEQIDVRGLRPGVYLLEVESEHQLLKQKFVKE